MTSTPVGFAALRMYDLPELREAAGRLWGAISARLPEGSAQLTWEGDRLEQWLDRDLVLGQTCAWPLVTTLAQKVTVVGAFRYGIDEDAPGAVYRSVVVAREDRPLSSFAGSVGAVNSWESLSGWVSLAHAVAPHAQGRPFFGEVVVTGGHAASLAAVSQAEADLGSIDAVTFRLFGKHVPESVEGLVVVGRGPLVPTLPLITAAVDPGPLRRAIEAALADPATRHQREQLMIEGFFPLDERDCASVGDLGTVAELVIPSPR